MKDFLKTTALGGALFLIPFVIIAMILTEAIGFLGQATQPLSYILPIESIDNALLNYIIPILLLLVICFISGLFAKTTTAAKIAEGLESKTLSRIPAYARFKNTLISYVDPNSMEGMKPVLLRNVRDYQIAFEIERIEGGKVAVFIPSSPNPWTGSVRFMSEDRIEVLGADPDVTFRILEGMGRGSNKYLAAHLSTE